MLSKKQYEALLEKWSGNAWVCAGIKLAHEAAGGNASSGVRWEDILRGMYGQ